MFCQVPYTILILNIYQIISHINSIAQRRYIKKKQEGEEGFDDIQIQRCNNSEASRDIQKQGARSILNAVMASNYTNSIIFKVTMDQSTLSTNVSSNQSIFSLMHNEQADDLWSSQRPQANLRGRQVYGSPPPSPNNASSHQRNQLGGIRINYVPQSPWLSTAPRVSLGGHDTISNYQHRPSSSGLVGGNNIMSPLSNSTGALRLQQREPYAFGQRRYEENHGRRNLVDERDMLLRQAKLKATYDAQRYEAKLKEAKEKQANLKEKITELQVKERQMQARLKKAERAEQEATEKKRQMKEKLEKAEREEKEATKKERQMQEKLEKAEREEWKALAKDRQMQAKLKKAERAERQTRDKESSMKFQLNMLEMKYESTIKRLQAQRDEAASELIAYQSKVRLETQTYSRHRVAEIEDEAAKKQKALQDELTNINFELIATKSELTVLKDTNFQLSIKQRQSKNEQALFAAKVKEYEKKLKMYEEKLEQKEIQYVSRLDVAELAQEKLKQALQISKLTEKQLAEALNIAQKELQESREKQKQAEAKQREATEEANHLLQKLKLNYQEYEKQKAEWIQHDPAMLKQRVWNQNSINNARRNGSS